LPVPTVLTVYSSLPPERNIAKAPTILLTCGNSLILVQFCPVLKAQLIIFWCVENAEEVDSKEALKFDDQQSPLLPNNVLEL
jgi:hypothetical protein